MIAEVVIASFVLSVGLIATMALISGSLKYSLDNQDAIVAAMLAQEGVELVRNVRDNDFVAGNSGFTSFSSSDKNCRIDYNDPVTSLDCASSQGSASQYTLTYSSGFYQHQDSSQERFSRYIHIDYDDSVGNENATVRSFVYWGTTMPPASGDPASCTALNKCIFTEIVLTNWKS